MFEEDVLKSGEDKEDQRMIMRSGSGGGQVDKEGYVTTLRWRKELEEGFGGLERGIRRREKWK